MHSGRDAGMGGMGFTPQSQGGTHIVERNLTRLTVVVGVIFFFDTIGALPPPQVARVAARGAPRPGRARGRRVRLSHPAAQPPFRDGPPGIARIALADLPWPLDPALAESRDEVQVARVLYSTPLRVGPHNHLIPGLCSSWRSEGYLRLDAALQGMPPRSRGELRRVGALQESPSRWLFDGARIRAQRGTSCASPLAAPVAPLPVRA